MKQAGIKPVGLEIVFLEEKVFINKEKYKISSIICL
jgi:hypothetical protein